MSGQLYAPAAFPRGELPVFAHGESPPGTNWIGSWLDPRGGLYDLESNNFFSSDFPSFSLQPFSLPTTPVVGLISRIPFHSTASDILSSQDVVQICFSVPQTPASVKLSCTDIQGRLSSKGTCSKHPESNLSMYKLA
jgi:hypothetical protein